MRRRRIAPSLMIAGTSGDTMTMRIKPGYISDTIGLVLLAAVVFSPKPAPVT